MPIKGVITVQNFPHLFSPIKIANHTYKNRMLSAPMPHTMYLLDEGTAERELRIFEDRAKGGLAEVIAGETPINYVDALDPMVPKEVDYTKRTGSVFESYKKLADIIKKYDAIALIELFHAGHMRGIMGGPPKTNPWGPVGYVRDNGVIIEAFDAPKMKKVCDDFAACASFMKAAGFDGICIHGAHGYLFTQFLSPATNSRKDEYGGSIENRGRFPREILTSIRKAMGPDFIVELRIDGSDMVEGGQTVEDTAAFCSTLDGLVDIIHISNGLHRYSYETHTFSSHYDPHGVNVERAAYVKKRTRIPVTVVGGINSPEFAEKIIAEGKVDFVSLGRQVIADPEFANKARDGRADEIRRCLRCYHCYGSGGPRRASGTSPAPPAFGMRGSLVPMLDGVEFCTINPRANNELKIDAMPAPQGSRKVLVVGGGPGGMQAAITAADRGHQVTLVEKDSSLGGVIRFSDTDIHKVDLKNFKDLLVREVNRRKVKVQLKTEATPEFITKFGADVVILAIGASPTVPPIPGLDTAMHVLEVFKKNAKIGQKVVMVGGGLAGVESAIQLADQGHEVTIVEMTDKVVAEAGGMKLTATLDQLKKRKNITVRTGAKCTEITPRGVKVEKASGGEEVIPGDTVVYSLGMNAKRAETERLHAAAGGANVFEATQEAFMAAMKII
jgi:2,4-dienoyl-CoA reductase-like NADH-dependent reductase (Old Yellow Enzyme family)/NADPH-dependent 2,4-dienoyl-CoA reductase/sulfur reductase-like enzyme